MNFKLGIKVIQKGLEYLCYKVDTRSIGKVIINETPPLPTKIG